MILGLIGVAASFYVPHKQGFSTDHSVGAALTGLVWMIMCFAITLRLIVHPG
jgi:hypothetical protein